MIIKKNKTIRRVSILFLAMILFVGLCGCTQKSDNNETGGNEPTETSQTVEATPEPEKTVNLVWSVEPTWDYDDVVDLAMPDPSDSETFVTNFFLGDRVAQEYKGSSVDLINTGRPNNYQQDYFVAIKDGKQGLIDRNGNFITNMEYESIGMSCGLIGVNKGNYESNFYLSDGSLMDGDIGCGASWPSYNLVAEGNGFALQDVYDDSLVTVSSEYQDNANNAVNQVNDTWVNHYEGTREAINYVDEGGAIIGTAIVDENGNLKKELEGYYIDGLFTNGIIRLNCNKLDTDANNFYYYNVDIDQLINDDYFDNGYYFVDGYCPVEKDGKWTFIDGDGNDLFGFIFDDAIPLSDGKAYVKYNGLWGILDINQTVAANQ